MGGITFNVIVGAMFYHPVSQHMKRVKKEKPEDSEQSPTKSRKEPIDIPKNAESQPLAIQMSPSPQQVAASQPISIPSAPDQQCHPQKTLFYFEGSPDQEGGDWITAQSASFLGPSIDKASVENSPSPLALREVIEQQENDGKKLDWDFFSTLPPAKQRLLRLSLRPTQNQAVAAALQGNTNAQPSLSRSFSSNVSLSSFR
jgi:hypothetical protein